MSTDTKAPGWTKHPIFKHHTLALEIENAAEAAAWQEIISFQRINKAFEAPVRPRVPGLPSKS